ncbi:MAG: Ty1/Copia family ribonuclease HI, partial [Plesiomonas shigelloides]
KGIYHQFQDIQMAEPEDETPILDKAGIKRIQQVVGVFLYYARAIDLTMLVALGTIATTQAKATENTRKAAIRLLNYAASHPNATIKFIASDMQLKVFSDASYLSEPKARSRVGGYFYLGGKEDPQPGNIENLNGAIHIESNIMRNVMSSAAEAEIGGLFLNGQQAVYIRNVLQEMGHKQHGPTTIITDNSTANGFANSTMKVKRSKAMDMRFYWIRDRVRQKQLKILWQKGSTNLADYFTKHHPPSVHQKMRRIYLHEKTSPILTTDKTECEGVLMAQARLTNSMASSSQPSSRSSALETSFDTQTLPALTLPSIPTCLLALYQDWERRRLENPSSFRQLLA